MKKILVLSDSHRAVEPMVRAVEAASPDLIFHLGDGWDDADQLHARFPDIPLEKVPGNCDSVWEDSERVLNVEGMPILICHGHSRGVKISLLNLQMAAQEKKVAAALFGHTHQVLYENLNGILYFNPGSIGAPPYKVPASYGILTVDGDAHKIEQNVIFLE